MSELRKGYGPINGDTNPETSPQYPPTGVRRERDGRTFEVQPFSIQDLRLVMRAANGAWVACTVAMVNYPWVRDEAREGLHTALDALLPAPDPDPDEMVDPVLWQQAFSANPSVRVFHPSGGNYGIPSPLSQTGSLRDFGEARAPVSAQRATSEYRETHTWTHPSAPAGTTWTIADRWDPPGKLLGLRLPDGRYRTRFLNECLLFSQNRERFIADELLSMFRQMTVGEVVLPSPPAVSDRVDAFAYALERLQGAQDEEQNAPPLPGSFDPGVWTLHAGVRAAGEGLPMNITGATEVILHAWESVPLQWEFSGSPDGQEWLPLLPDTTTAVRSAVTRWTFHVEGSGWRSFRAVLLEPAPQPVQVLGQCDGVVAEERVYGDSGKDLAPLRFGTTVPLVPTQVYTVYLARDGQAVHSLDRPGVDQPAEILRVCGDPDPGTGKAPARRFLRVRWQAAAGLEPWQVELLVRSAHLRGELDVWQEGMNDEVQKVASPSGSTVRAIDPPRSVFECTNHEYVDETSPRFRAWDFRRSSYRGGSFHFDRPAKVLAEGSGGAGAGPDGTE